MRLLTGTCMEHLYEKGRSMRRPLLALALLLTLFAMAPAAAAEESVFLHLTADFKEDDGPVCVAFNAAWQALLDGNQVILFFDQAAAYGVKEWEPGRTDLSLYPLPERIKDLLVTTFAVERESIPENYQDYLKFLSELGASITVNGFWNALTEIESTVKGTEHILEYVEPLTLAEMLERRRSATIYMKF